MQLTLTRIYEENAAAWLSSTKPGGKRRALNEGGTWASKTISILQLLIMIAQGAKSQFLISVVSESMPHLKRGCMRDFINILQDAFEDSCWNKSDSIYDFSKSKHFKGKGIIEFFSADEPSKLRGGRRKILFINECNNVSYDSYRELDIRTELFTFLDWNPVAEFWAHTEKLVSAPENAYIHSTYLDALDVLPPEAVANIESNKDKDQNWWNVYGLGILGTLEHLIWPRFKIIDNLPPKCDWTSWGYGLDFGFTNESALVKGIVSDGQLYWDECLYEKKLTNAQIIEKLSHEERGDIWADSAEPDRIKEINMAGYNCYPANKHVKTGLDVVKRQILNITKKSVNIIKEGRNYSYKKDRDGKILEEPVKINDHACLAAGTLINTIRGLKKIEEINSGDLVLTRKGYKPVLNSGLTNPQAEVYRLILNDGKELIGTGSHPVYFNKSFLRLDTGRYGDIIETCEMNEYYLKESHLEDTLIPHTDMIDVISSPVIINLMEQCIFIRKYIKTIMAKFPRALMSITKTIIRLIITSKIWKFYQNMTTCLFTQNKGLLTSNNSQGCGLLLWNGIGRQKEESGIVFMGKKHGLKESLYKRNVSSAVNLLKISRDMNLHASVLIVANRNGGDRQDLITKQEYALSVRKNTSLTNTAGHRHAHTNVVVSSLEKLDLKLPVYNLTIAEVSEYYANGILVHNCDGGRYVTLGLTERYGYATAGGKGKVRVPITYNTERGRREAARQPVNV